mmetsp:Transcript_45761/g.148777  ORF Transcript_45761/g.148777 Transcript_45761/m.148777 type:complete len:251 (+) Transcript_45761:411-1163(+)
MAARLWPAAAPAPLRLGLRLGRLPVVRRAAAQQRVEHAPRRPDVRRAAVEVLCAAAAREMALGSHEVGRASPLRHARRRLRVEGGRAAKVDQHERGGVGHCDEHIIGLDVAVCHALAVGVGERLEEEGRQPPRLDFAEHAARRARMLPQLDALKVLKHERRPERICLVRKQTREEPSRGNIGAGEEACEHLRLVRDVRRARLLLLINRANLDSDRPIPEVSAEPHGPKHTLAERSLESVVLQPGRQLGWL